MYRLFDCTTVQKDEDRISKLPKLTLPKLSSNIREVAPVLGPIWVQHWPETYTGRRQISYLFCCLEGEALKSIEGLNTSYSNYQIAIETLQDRYGKQEDIINAHHKAFRCLPPATDKTRDCRNLLNEIERHLLKLESWTASIWEALRWKSFHRGLAMNLMFGYECWWHLCSFIGVVRNCR